VCVLWLEGLTLDELQAHMKEDSVHVIRRSLEKTAGGGGGGGASMSFLYQTCLFYIQSCLLYKMAIALTLEHATSSNMSLLYESCLLYMTHVSYI
jgi:hypothetical protein